MLLVGAGGIGCELLETLDFSGFQDNHMVSQPSLLLFLLLLLVYGVIAVLVIVIAAVRIVRV